MNCWSSATQITFWCVFMQTPTCFTTIYKKCKTCSIQSAGVTVPGSPEEEYCGDELEKIEDENVCVLGTGYCCD